MQASSYTTGVRLIEVLAAAFINTFGITQPSEAQRRQAAWFIMGMMVLSLIVVSAVGYAFHLAMRR